MDVLARVLDYVLQDVILHAIAVQADAKENAEMTVKARAQDAVDAGILVPTVVLVDATDVVDANIVMVNVRQNVMVVNGERKLDGVVPTVQTDAKAIVVLHAILVLVAKLNVH